MQQYPSRWRLRGMKFLLRVKEIVIIFYQYLLDKKKYLSSIGDSFYGHLLSGTSCCRKIIISFKGQWQPHHKHYSGTFHMISSRPLLYKNNKLQLYITKDIFGTWVVGIVQIIFKSQQSLKDKRI